MSVPAPLPKNYDVYTLDDNYAPVTRVAVSPTQEGALDMACACFVAKQEFKPETHYTLGVFDPDDTLVAAIGDLTR